jgi:hypothetical protein
LLPACDRDRLLAMLWFPLLLLSIVLLARALGHRRVKPWTANLETMQTALTVAAISFAIGWYFFERPDAAKVEFAQNVQGYPGVGGTALALIEISVKNVGSAALHFEDEPYAIFLQQITPITSEPWREYRERLDQGLPPQLQRGDNWSLVQAIVGGSYPLAGLEPARITAGPGLNSIIEAGETDNYYFRTLVACKPGLRFYVTSRFDKPSNWYEVFLSYFRARPPLRWIKQSVLDLSAVCSKEPVG